MIEDKFTEKIKRKAADLGLIVNAGADKPKQKPPKSKDKKGGNPVEKG